MARRFGLAVLLLLLVSMLFCSAVLAQEEQPTPIGEEPTGTEEATPGHIYLYLNGELVQVERDVTAGNQMAEFALLELLKGPSEEEKSAGYVTYIPEGVKLQYTTIKQDRSEFSANLSREMLELSGDPEAAEKALTQIVKTLQDVTGIQVINITIAGEGMGDTPLDAYEALGVSPEADGDSEETSGGGNTLLIILIVLGVILAGILVFLSIYILRRRKGSESEPRAKKKTAEKKKNKKKKAKK